MDNFGKCRLTFLKHNNKNDDIDNFTIIVYIKCKSDRWKTTFKLPKRLDYIN